MIFLKDTAGRYLLVNRAFETLFNVSNGKSGEKRLTADRDCVEGTGLGLALTKRLTEEMGGRIGIESAVGEGSTFWVELPRVQPPELPPAREMAPARLEGAGGASRVVLYETILAAGAHAYLTKPLDVPEFLRLLDEQLGRIAPAAR